MATILLCPWVPRAIAVVEPRHEWVGVQDYFLIQTSSPWPNYCSVQITSTFQSPAYGQRLTGSLYMCLLMCYSWLELVPLPFTQKGKKAPTVFISHERRTYEQEHRHPMYNNFKLDPTVVKLRLLRVAIVEFPHLHGLSIIYYRLTFSVGTPLLWTWKRLVLMLVVS